MKKVILFDLDGTLLPMDQEVFTKAYFSRLAKFLMPFGYAPKKVVEDPIDTTNVESGQFRAVSDKCMQIITEAIKRNKGE